jgi:hypothetical protein
MNCEKINISDLGFGSLISAPWQICMTKVKGITHYSAMQHTEPSICVALEDAVYGDEGGYFEKGYKPKTDEYGYYQPDKNMDTMNYRVNQAKLFSIAPMLLEMAVKMVNRCEDEHFRLYAIHIINVAKFTTELDGQPVKISCDDDDWES